MPRVLFVWVGHAVVCCVASSSWYYGSSIMMSIRERSLSGERCSCPIGIRHVSVFFLFEGASFSVKMTMRDKYRPSVRERVVRETQVLPIFSDLLCGMMSVCVNAQNRVACCHSSINDFTPTISF